VKTRPILLDFARALSGQDQEIQATWIITAKTQLLEFGSAVSTVVTSVVLPAFKALAGLMQQVANGINAVFGTKITPADIVVTLVIAKLVGGFLSLLGVLSVFRGAWTLVVGMVAALGGPLSIVLTLIQGLSGILVIVAEGAVGLVAALGGVPVLLAAIGAALGFLAVRLAQGVNWQNLADGAARAVQSITGFFSGLWESITGLFATGIAGIATAWGAVTSGAQAVWTAIVSGAQLMWDTITGSFSSGVNSVIGFLTRVRDFAISVWNAITGAAQSAASAQASAAEAGGGPGFARGGPIHGPGTATSDSIPIWASAGEFMVRAAAVRKYGVEIFHALNAMRLPKGLFRGFARGGLVERLQVMMPPVAPLRFADGGQVPALASSQLRPINLQIGPELFAGLLAPEDVADRLVRASVSQQVRSAGRKPTYFGGSR
jgi:hypothetical protein